MRRTMPIPIVVSVVVLLAAGCASQRAQLATAVDTYAATLQVLADARRAGLLDDQAAAEIERWRVVAREALDSWREAIDAGDAADSAIQRFNEAMRELMRARLSAEGRRGDEGG